MSSSGVESLGCSFRDDPDESEEWYIPSPEDFRPEYNDDTANQQKQTWNQYWGWVKTFYDGRFFCAGWTDRAKGVTSVVTSGPKRRKIIREITIFGKDICKEWAKDPSVGKIGTADLIRWGKVVEKAKAEDDGSGTKLGRAVAAIKAEYQKKRSSHGAGARSPVFCSSTASAAAAARRTSGAGSSATERILGMAIAAFGPNARRAATASARESADSD
jgi:hypothetical protein